MSIGFALVEESLSVMVTVAEAGLPSPAPLPSALLRVTLKASLFSE